MLRPDAFLHRSWRRSREGWRRTLHRSRKADTADVDSAWCSRAALRSRLVSENAVCGFAAATTWSRTNFGGRPQPPRIGEVHAASSSDGRVGDMSRPPLTSASAIERRTADAAAAAAARWWHVRRRPQPPSAYSQQQPPAHPMQQPQSTLNVVPAHSRRCHLSNSSSRSRRL